MTRHIGRKSRMITSGLLALVMTLMLGAGPANAQGEEKKEEKKEVVTKEEKKVVVKKEEKKEVVTKEEKKEPVKKEEKKEEDKKPAKLLPPYPGYQPSGFSAAVGALGFAYGLTDDSVGGFKIGLSYDYRLTRLMWFDAQANFSFGGDCKQRAGGTDPDRPYICGGVRGFGIDLLAGIQFKWFNVWKVPVVPFVRGNLGVVFIISDGPNDGVAAVARVGGGFRYNFFKWFAVGGELAATIGPAFRNDLDTGLFAVLEVLAGAEFFF